MPPPFDITTASSTVTLDNNRRGMVSFTVKNNTGRRVHSSSTVQTNPPDGSAWLTVVPPNIVTTNPPNVRDFTIDGTQEYAI